MRETNLLRRILKGAKAGAREGNVLFAAWANLEALFRKTQQFLRGLDHVFGNLELEPCLAGGEPALRHRGRQGLPGKFEIGPRRRVSGLIRVASVAQPAPQVRLPGNAEREDLQGIATAHFRAAASKKTHGRLKRGSR